MFGTDGLDGELPEKAGRNHTTTADRSDTFLVTVFFQELGCVVGFRFGSTLVNVIETHVKLSDCLIYELKNHTFSCSDKIIISAASQIPL